MSYAETIRYAALGDSYTIGTGATPETAWPSVLTQRLKTQGWPIDLVGNFGRNGWTAQDVIDVELAELKESQANFATLLIGTNDWVHQVPADVFRRQLNAIINEMIRVVGHSGRLIVFTLPDYSVTPSAKDYFDGRDVSQGLSDFNAVIREECQSRNVLVIDLFDLSRQLGQQQGMIAQDGLHPSARGYAAWENFMESIVIQRLERITGEVHGTESAKR